MVHRQSMYTNDTLHHVVGHIIDRCIIETPSPKSNLIERQVNSGIYILQLLFRRLKSSFYVQLLLYVLTQ